MQHTQQGPYTHWEYKIVRSRQGEFADRRHLEALLRQESRAGWIMVEKYDDSQVRFKRLHNARSRDQRLPPDIDPYRTVYSPVQTNPTFQLVFLAASLIFVLALIVLIVVLVTWPG